MRTLTTLVLFALCTSLIAQNELSKRDISSIEKHARKAPKRLKKDTKQLGAYLAQGASTERGKVYAISYWIARNIRYDYGGYLSRRMVQHHSLYVLRKRRALCGEYAQLFTDLCDGAGINSVLIGGYTKPFDLFPGDSLYRAEHAWSAYSIEGSWHLSDLTWSSGYLKRKRQLIKNLLWRWFNRPYNIKFRYVHSFNPDWLGVAPSQMIQSHFPLLDEHQLLSPSVSIDAYLNERQFLSDSTDLKKVSNANFHAENELKEWSRLRREGNSNNPVNHRVEGFYTFLIADSLHKVILDDHKEQGYIAPYLADSIQTLTAHSDSLLLLAYQDCSREYRSYQLRNSDWKSKLKDTNNALKDELRALRKGKKRSARIVKRSRVKRDRMRASLRRKARSIRKKRLGKVRTSGIDSLSIIHADSLIELGKSGLEMVAGIPEKKQVILANSSIQKQKESLKYEVESRKAIWKLKRNFRKQVKFNKMTYSLIHKNDLDILKPNFCASMTTLLTIDQVQSGPIIQATEQDLILSSDTMTHYYKVHKQVLSRVKKAYRISADSLGAEALFWETKTNCLEEIGAYDRELKKQLIKEGSLLRSLRRQQKNAFNLIRLLKKDDKIENQRFRVYRQYRKSIKDTEQARLRKLRSHLRKMRRTIKTQ